MTRHGLTAPAIRGPAPRGSPLYGGDGNDTTRYARGDGNDIVDDGNAFGGTADKLVLAGVNPSAVSLERSGDNVTLVIAPSTAGGTDGGRITLTRQLDAYYEKGIEQIVFADGTTWSNQDLRQKVVTMASTAGDDPIVGINTGDLIQAGAGNDTIDARGGDDVIVGGLGNDTIYGGDGNDTIRYARGDGYDIVDDGNAFGGTADKLVLTGVNPSAVSLERSGDDVTLVIAPSTSGGTDGGRITLTRQLDAYYEKGIEQIVFADGTTWSNQDLRQKVVTMANTAGDDTLYGTPDVDTIRGLAGNDVISGRDGDDLLYGDADNDQLNGEAGNDLLDGGTGNDAMAGGVGDDVYYVDATADTVTEASGAGTDEVRTTLASYTLGSEVENLTYLGTAAFAGTDNALANALTGGGGADNLTGGAGNDVYRGLAGNDTFYGGAGANSHDGGDGFDTVAYNATAAIVVDVLTPSNSTGDAAGDTFTSIEQWGLSAYNDRFVGGTGNDYVHGKDGNDTLLGGGGNDSLAGNAGADSLDGGDGIDTADYTWASAAVVIDCVAAANSSGEAAGDTFTSIEAFQLTAGYADRFVGSSSAETVFGNGGDDTLIGNGGNDSLDGGTGDDKLNGGAGDLTGWLWTGLIERISQDQRSWICGEARRRTRSRSCSSCARLRCRRPRARVWPLHAGRRRSPSRVTTAGARSTAAFRSIKPGR